MPGGEKKPRSDCLGQVNFDVGKEKNLVPSGQEKLRLACPVSMSESVSLVNDNFQTEDCKVSDTIS